MTSVLRLCPKCGAEIPPDAPEGACPGCLLETGLGLFLDAPVAAGGDGGSAENVEANAAAARQDKKAARAAEGGGKLKIVPYTVHHLSFGDTKEDNVRSLYDGPFPWENMFGFHLAGGRPRFLQVVYGDL